MRRKDAVSEANPGHALQSGAPSLHSSNLELTANGGTVPCLAAAIWHPKSLAGSTAPLRMSAEMLPKQQIDVNSQGSSTSVRKRFKS